MGAEYATVVVAFVDDDVVEAPEERSPGGVLGEHRPVDEVGVGEDVVRVGTSPGALVTGGIAIDRGGAQPRQVQFVEASQLVVREGLGRGEV